MSIEDIVFEPVSAPTQKETAKIPQARTWHAVFHSFLSNYSKQDSDTTTAHIKHIIECLKQCNIMYDKLLTLLENIDGCH